MVQLRILGEQGVRQVHDATLRILSQVGITLTLVEMSSGKILWEASDENYREAVRSEDRNVVTSGGIDRRVGGVTSTGKDMYAAPPYEEVATVVLQALVGALPPRAATGQ